MTDRQRAIDIKLTNEIHFMDMYVCLYLCSCIYRHNVCNVYYFMDEIRKITTNKLQRQHNQRKKEEINCQPMIFYLYKCMYIESCMNINPKIYNKQI